MIITTQIIIGGKTYIKNESDAGLRIRKTGTTEVYDSAVDRFDSGYTYEETEDAVGDAELSDAEALAIITGGGEGA